MNAKQWLSLIGMTFAAFLFNTSEIMPVGLLTDIAADFSVSEAGAGLIVSVYAWFVALFSLPLMMLASRFEMKKLLIAMVFVFAIGQVISGIASSYAMLMGGRLVVAVAHSIFWSIAAPMAVRAVPEKSKPLALSLLAIGTSLAMILGLPLGRWIGLLVGWRMTFMVVAAVAVLLIIFLTAVFPAMPSRGSFTLGKLPGLLKNKMLLSIYLIIFVFVSAYFTTYSYIEPFMLQVIGLSPDQTTLSLVFYGIAGILGSLAFSKLYAKSPSGFIMGVMAAMTLSLALIYPLSPLPILAVAICSLMGFCMTASNVALQSELLRAAPEDSTSVAMSIYSGIFNLGIGSGTFAGGLVCDHLSINYVGFLGAAVAAAALIFCATGLRKLMGRQNAA